MPWRIDPGLAGIFVSDGFGCTRFRDQQMLGVRQHKFRFKNKLLSLDSTTISLCLTMFPWAKFRRTKGAARIVLGIGSLRSGSMTQVVPEPIERQRRNLAKRSRLLEEMSGARHNRYSFRTLHLRKSLLVQFDHRLILAAHNQQGGRRNAAQGRSRQIRAAAAGDNSAYRRPLRCGNQSRTGPRARAEITDPQFVSSRFVLKPIGCLSETFGKQADIKA